MLEYEEVGLLGVLAMLEMGVLCWLGGLVRLARKMRD